MNDFSRGAPAVKLVVLLLAVLLAFAAPRAAAQQGSGFKFLEVKLVDPEGKPATDVSVEVSLDGVSFPMSTDDKGMIALNVLAGDESRVRLAVKQDGYVALGASWEKGETVPDEFTIPLEKAVAIGGIVQDEAGNPIEGATVEGVVVTNGSTDLLGKGQLTPYYNGEIATTDAEGRWQTNTAPSKPMRLQLRFSHPEFVSDRGYGYRGGTWDQLRSLEHIVVLEKGIELHGTVTDPDGQPVAGARVAVGASRFDSKRQVVETDDNGEYRLQKIAAGPTVLTVSSPDWAPDTRTVTAKRDADPADFQLEPPHTVRLRVVDPEGQPIQGVTIIPEEWRGNRSLEDPFGRKATDADGIWEWHAAPADEIQYSIFMTGRIGVPDWQACFSASDEIQEVTMLPAIVVNGKVVDKQTGQPIDKFNYVEGVWWEPTYDRYVLQRSGSGNVGRDGQFRFDMENGCFKFMILVEAEGYRPVESREILPEEGEVSLVFEMVAGSGPTGVVKLPDGSPASGVKVAMATSNQQVSVYNGELETDFAAGNGVTDAEGRFKMPFPESDFAIVCVGDVGWAVVYADQATETVEATLEPWGGLVGVALRGNEPRADEQISLYTMQTYDINAPRVYWQSHTKTDDSGHFAFERLQSGPATVSRRVRYADRGDSWMSANSHTVNVDVRAGETATVQLGGTGRTVTGRLTIPADYNDEVAWHMGSVSLTEQLRPTGVQGFFYELGEAIGHVSELSRGKPVQPAPRTQPCSYAATIDEEGRFEIEDVPPGDYRLRVTLYAPVTGSDFNWNPVGRLDDSVTVAETDQDTSQPADLGEHELKVTNP